ncbi:hypothetical protein JXR01_03575 [Candidatus Kaiserbacteria bacterium]|nr:MAG: hypothetical protein JXR01_03575 [Candidatus Kaiserbacteria bacterium]
MVNSQLGLDWHHLNRAIQLLEEMGAIHTEMLDQIPMEINGRQVLYEDDGSAVLSDEYWLSYTVTNADTLRQEYQRVQEEVEANPELAQTDEAYSTVAVRSAGDFSLYADNRITYKQRQINFTRKYKSLFLRLFESVGNYVVAEELADALGLEGTDNWRRRTGQDISELQTQLRRTTGERLIRNQREHGWGLFLE